jgi:hypothetical protein
MVKSKMDKHKMVKKKKKKKFDMARLICPSARALRNILIIHDHSTHLWTEKEIACHGIRANGP